MHCAIKGSGGHDNQTFTLKKKTASAMLMVGTEIYSAAAN